MLNALKKKIVIIIIRQCLLTIDNKLLKKDTQIWKKVNTLMSLEFDCEPFYDDNDEYIQTKIKIYDDNINTKFQGKKIPNKNTLCKCFSLIMLDSIIRVHKEYYPQTLLEERKYKIRKRLKWRILLMMN